MQTIVGFEIKQRPTAWSCGFAAVIRVVRVCHALSCLTERNQAASVHRAVTGQNGVGMCRNGMSGST
jgi:hypothetical protein